MSPEAPNFLVDKGVTCVYDTSSEEAVFDSVFD